MPASPSLIDRQSNDPSFPDVWEELVWRGLVHVSTDAGELKTLLAGEPITYYCGFDPTAPSLHLGNLVQLLTMRRIQLAGHKPLGLVGGSTGLIGDPRPTAERTLNTKDTVAEWVGYLQAQVQRFLSFDGANAARMVNNLDWTVGLSAIDFLRDVGKYANVNQMIARESVKARLESENGISFTEFSYQLLQANDYLHLCRNHGVDLQVGGSDQWGNLLAGVDLIRRADGKHVHALTWPLLLRSDGHKFGKSEDGAIWLAADRTSPYQFFQYWMNVADADIERFLLQLTLLPVEDCRAIAAEHAEAPHRRSGQRRLAREVTTIVHGPEATAAAQEASAILFGGSPAGASVQALEFLATEVPTSPFTAGVTLAAALAATPLASSLSDARRTISQGAVSVNGSVAGEDRPLVSGDLLYSRWLLLRKGKRNYHLLDAATS